MSRIALSMSLFTSSCVAMTTGVTVTPVVDTKGEVDVISVVSGGIGLPSDSGHTFFSMDLEAGASLRAPLVGASLSYTKISPKRGWRVGWGGLGAPLTNGGIMRVFGHYIIAQRSKTEVEEPVNDKYWFRMRRSNYRVLSIGPEIVLAGDERSNDMSVGIGLSFRVAWFVVDTVNR